MKTQFGMFLYTGFLIIGIYQTMFSKDYMQATASFGIGFAFDPFNPEKKWNDRTFWQKIVLLLHLSIITVFFGLCISNIKVDSIIRV